MAQKHNFNPNQNTPPLHFINNSRSFSGSNNNDKSSNDTNTNNNNTYGKAMIIDDEASNASSYPSLPKSGMQAPQNTNALFNINTKPNTKSAQIKHILTALTQNQQSVIERVFYNIYHKKPVKSQTNALATSTMLNANYLKDKYGMGLIHTLLKMNFVRHTSEGGGDKLRFDTDMDGLYVATVLRILDEIKQRRFEVESNKESSVSSFALAQVGKGLDHIGVSLGLRAEFRIARRMEAISRGETVRIFIVSHGQWTLVDSNPNNYVYYTYNGQNAQFVSLHMGHKIERVPICDQYIEVIAKKNKNHN